tara:strand:+ start:5143 stop:5604 length:462 start_codon:yes stop_codon:yes gene_type:complete
MLGFFYKISESPVKTPLHLWIVGIVSLLWNVGGGYDYVMTQMKNQAYLGVMPQVQRDFLDSAPVWFDGLWAIGVWFSILGSVLLLARSRLARTSFGLSFLGLLGAAIYRFGFAKPAMLQVTPPEMLAFSGAIAVVLIVLYIYAKAMTRAGVLR